MSTVIVTKGQDGKLQGLGDAGQRAYTRFLGRVKDLEPGETMRFSFWLPRSPGFHRRHFLILAAVFQQQDQFQDPEKLREWLQVGAGFCDILPGPKGNPVAISRSIAWENLDDADFAEHHAAVVAFMRSIHCTRFLWPHLADLKADELINGVLASVDA